MKEIANIYLRDRDNITASSNIVVNSDIIGKKAILVDDVITTGKSLREHIKELAMFNVEIVGAVFLAKSDTISILPIFY